MNLTELSNEEVVSGLMSIAGDARAVLAKLLAYLGEVDARRLYRDWGCSSMFRFCVERLLLSEGEAQRRITAARAAREYPMIIDAIATGDLNITSIEILHPYLTVDNHEELLRSAFRKTKIEVQELAAARHPRPDAPSLISPMPTAATPPAAAPPQPVPHVSAAPRVEPLSAERYKVQVTVSKALRDKIESVKALMRHRNPSGDLEVIFEQAIELLHAKLEKERLAKTDKPRSVKKGAKGVSAAARRETFERDGTQCTYVSADGHRCSEHGYLEVDDRDARGRGGSDDASNLRVLCRAHNLLLAEQTFGRAYVERKIEEKRHLCQQRYEWSTVTSALTNLGFRDGDVRRAIRELTERFTNDEAPIEAVIREGIALLT